jgi:acyl-CoA reductase-like NAD-dependent aldehyde dehydrogenase
MRLYIDTMDATLVDINDEGRVRFENEEWSTPTLQERRAILHAAKQQAEALADLITVLEKP